MSSENTVQSQDAMVHVGKEDWLFLVGGANKVMDLFSTESLFTEEHASKWFTLLNERQRRLATLGIDYCHLPAPEKLSVLHRFYDGDIENIGGSPITQLSTRYPTELDCFINPLPQLQLESHTNQVYWKTDSHWSFWGFYTAYKDICAQLGAIAITTFPDNQYNEVTRMFDLGMKLKEPVKELARTYFIAQNAERVARNRLVEFKEENDLENAGNLHVGSSVVFKNEKPVDSRRVMLFGDSFSDYRPNSLTGMLAETFSEVTFVWSARLDFDLIEEVRPDIVISELAERFMTVVPSDDLSLDSFAKERIANYEAGLKPEEKMTTARSVVGEENSDQEMSEARRGNSASFSQRIKRFLGQVA